MSMVVGGNKYYGNIRAATSIKSLQSLIVCKRRIIFTGIPLDLTIPTVEWIGERGHEVYRCAG